MSVLSLQWSGDEAAATFIGLLRRVQGAAELNDLAWERVIGLGRRTRLLATLGDRIAGAGLQDAIPERVWRHFESARRIAEYQQHMVRFGLTELSRVLAPLGIPIVALKGAAYVLQQLPHARGRMVSDVDVMVEREHLERAEAALRVAGWDFDDLTPYDEQYYRRWSHELPPLHHPRHHLEVDLHHTILPVTNRARPSSRALFTMTRPIPQSAWSVLSAEDQVIHACLHLFQDSDCSGRLRDLVDLDGLLSSFCVQPGFWERLRDRARLHGAGRSVWYGLRYASIVLDPQLPSGAERSLEEFAPTSSVVSLMDRLVPRVLVPSDRADPLGVRRGALFMRAQWLRMPPWLLAWHAMNKGARGVADWWQGLVASSGAAR